MMKLGLIGGISSSAVLVLAAISAQADGTGSGGCYFNACDDDKVPDREIETKPQPKIPNTSEQKLLCVTLYGGSCVMVDQNYPVGGFCSCPGPMGVVRVDGVTQLVNSTTYQQPQTQIAYQCMTNQGGCQLFAPVAAGSQCTCITDFGQYFPGIAQ